jgi:sugar lactone lactonase YvrE
MRKSLLLALLAFFLLAPAAHPENAPYLFSGPLPSLLAPGAAAAANTAGLPFEIKITAGGRKVEGGSFALTVPDAQKPFRLTLDGAAFAAGKLTAKAIIGNSSGAALEGLRLDLVQATETYTKKDAEGKVTTETRPQKVAAEPLHFGDLDVNETSDALPLVATGLAFGAETAQIVVRGVVSGLRYEKTVANPTACGSGEIDVDDQGNIYLSDTCGQRIARLTPAGEISGFELPNQAKGAARDPASGRLAATYANYPEIRIIGAESQVLGTIGEAQGIDTWPDFLRFDAQGKLWVEASATIRRFSSTGKLEQRIASIAGTDLDSILSFDIAPDGTLWVVSAGALWRLPADGKAGARLVGPGLRPGELTAPVAPRAAPDGSVWVIEASDATHGAPERVSVFDREGRLIRIFGRGARAALPTFPDAYHEAQLFLGTDLAFGPENRVYIASQRPGANGEYVMVFRRF